MTDQETRDRRKATAEEFYRSDMHLPASDVQSHVAGIDLNQEVEVRRLRANDLLTRHESPTAATTGTPSGHYFTPIGQTSEKVGIVGESSASRDRRADHFVVTRDTDVLASTAANFPKSSFNRGGDGRLAEADPTFAGNGELRYGGEQQVYVRSQDAGNVARVVDRHRSEESPQGARPTSSTRGPSGARLRGFDQQASSTEPTLEQGGRAAASQTPKGVRLRGFEATPSTPVQTNDREAAPQRSTSSSDSRSTFRAEQPAKSGSSGEVASASADRAADSEPRPTARVRDEAAQTPSRTTPPVDSDRAAVQRVSGKEAVDSRPTGSYQDRSGSAHARAVQGRPRGQFTAEQRAELKEGMRVKSGRGRSSTKTAISDGASNSRQRGPASPA
jgi:hypothetical protein